MMKTYELIVERLQPVCGGKSPKEVKMSTVTTDDPMAYVKSLEPDGEPVQQVNAAGEIVITLDQGAKHITYTFTED